MRKILTAIICAGALSACGGGGGGNTSFSLSVTDAPVDNADAVVIAFTKAELLDQDGKVAQTFTYSPAKEIDLLQQQGNKSEFLIDDAQIPPGVYGGIRLYVDASNASCSTPTDSYITISGTSYPLAVPSAGTGQSGYKVMGTMTAAAGGKASYTVDFNLRKSIAARGNNASCYNLKPVLRVVDNATVGTLSGTIDPSMLSDSSCTATVNADGSVSGAAVYVYEGNNVTPDDVGGSGSNPLTTALLTPVFGNGTDQPATAYQYEVGYLLSGPYTAAFTCQAGDDLADSDENIVFADPVATDLNIIENTTTTQDFPVSVSP